MPAAPAPLGTVQAQQLDLLGGEALASLQLLIVVLLLDLLLVLLLRCSSPDMRREDRCPSPTTQAWRIARALTLRDPPLVSSSASATLPRITCLAAGLDAKTRAALLVKPRFGAIAALLHRTSEACATTGASMVAGCQGADQSVVPGITAKPPNYAAAGTRHENP